MRTAYQGVGNIIRFNWHFYLLALVGVGVGLVVAHWLGGAWWVLGIVIAGGVLLTTLVSLIVSWYIYDRSDLYTLNWLDPYPDASSMLNIHAGFDETSALLAEKYPTAQLRVMDFYDPFLHTEVSIQRARRMYPPYPDTEVVNTGALPLVPGSVDVIFVLLSAHEIRNEEERIHFFQQLKQALKLGGEIVITEHLRDGANFLAYTLGFFHFYSRASWLQIFRAAGFDAFRERKITPFLSTFTLVNDGTPP
ncbi:MAG: class I SAM-dependent methyltransferase [Bacteroidota bacterium]